MEEIVRAFNYVIERGWAFYWATSEWSARDIEEAWHVADRLGLVGPVAEQCQHQCVFFLILFVLSSLVVGDWKREMLMWG